MPSSCLHPGITTPVDFFVLKSRPFTRRLFRRMHAQLLLLTLLAASSLAGPRFHPVVTVTDAHGETLSKQIFLWMNRLSEIKDSVQLKYRAPKDTMVLWYIPVDRDGYQTAPVYNLDDSLTFAEADNRYNEGKRGFFGVTMYL